MLLLNVLVLFLSLTKVEAQSQQMPLLEFDGDHSAVTFTHAISVNIESEWREKFLQEYETLGRPPTEWFTFSDAGLWFAKRPLVGSLEQLQYWGDEGALRFSHYKGEESVLLVVNIKKDVGWYEITDHNKRVWQEWLNQNGNRPNTFSGHALARLKTRDLPWHSEFYRDYNLAGYKIISFVLLNPETIAESKLLIPDRQRMTFKSILSSCRFLFN